MLATEPPMKETGCARAKYRSKCSRNMYKEIKKEIACVDAHRFQTPSSVRSHDGMRLLFGRTFELHKIVVVAPSASLHKSGGLM
jgi:hypothetical protein